MDITQLIKRLEAMREKHGDLPVLGVNGYQETIDAFQVSDITWIENSTRLSLPESIPEGPCLILWDQPY
jgi:hypothetical protein